MNLTRHGGVVSFLGMVAAAIPTAAWAEAPAINHDAVGCIVADKFPRLEARFDPTENVSRGRLRFRPTGGAHWYSVPMNKEAEAFVGILPKPTPKLKSLDYYVEVTATDFATGRTREYTPAVVSGLGACQADKITAGSLGSASVTLEVPAGAPAIPPGFSGVGIASGTAAVAVAAAATGGGVGGTALVLGGLAVAGAGTAAAVVLSKNTDSGDGDGGGSPPTTVPCIQSTAQVEFAIDPAFSGDVGCSAPNNQQTYRVTNNSACVLAVNQMTVTHSQRCDDGAVDNVTFNIGLEFGFVPPNSSVVIRRGSPAGTVRIPFCCLQLVGCNGRCTITETFTLSTSAGSKTTQYVYVQDPNLAQCPLCSAPAPSDYLD
jgi:hypothetical protein